MRAQSAEEFQSLLVASGLVRSDASHLIGEIASKFRGIRLKQGQVLSPSGECPRWLAIVEAGAVRQTYYDNSRSITIEKYGINRLLCANEIIRRSSYYSFNACEETILRVLDGDTFRAMIGRDIIQETLTSSVTVGELFEALRCSEMGCSIEAARLFDFCCATYRHDNRDWISAIQGKLSTIKPNKREHVIVSGNTESNRFEIGENISKSTQFDAFNEEIRCLCLSERITEQLRQIKELQLSRPAPKLDSGENSRRIAREAIPSQEYFEATAHSSLTERYGENAADKTTVFPNQEVANRHDQASISTAILKCLSQYFGIPYRRDSIERAIRQRVENQPEFIFSLFTYSTLADLLDIRAEVIRVSLDDIGRIEFPALALDPESKLPKLLWDGSSRTLTCCDFSESLRVIESSILFSKDSNQLIDILVFSRSSYARVDRFGLKWFLPTLSKHKRTLSLVFISSFFVQLLALLNPLLIQQIIDAVISQGNISSLNVYGTLLVGMALTEGILSALRTFLLTDTTNRIDLSLGGMVIDHLLRLPLGYFSKRPVGEVSNRVNELEKIREFLTGTGLTSVLDALYAFVYIAVMLVYSVTLTLWSLSVIPLFLVLAFVFAPLIRRQIERRSEAYASVQSHLVEALGGVETIKTQNLEFQSKWRWRQLYNKQIQRSFKTAVISSTAGSISKFLEQLSGLIIIWVGASLVLKSELTVGQLIAFRILSGYVTGPILRLATLWQNFQETSISIQRLGDVVNTPTESEIHGKSLIPMPPILGKVSYQGVSFRFTPNTPLQLNNVSLEIEAGEFIGIVGGSGSGKSTLVKLLTGLYRPESGSIKIDGYDIGKVDLYSLRSQVGIVPQDSLLFDGTIRDNIAISRPDACLQEIQQAAEIACASEFIDALPAGLASSVGERGAGLSGGQRQRIAIARMLVSRPHMVILDEATSALDVDTERRLLRNLACHLSDRTLLFITHRISTIKDADKIIVMDKGLVDEVGTHDHLVAKHGRYAALLAQQYAEGLVE